LDAGSFRPSIQEPVAEFPSASASGSCGGRNPDIPGAFDSLRARRASRFSCARAARFISFRRLRNDGLWADIQLSFRALLPAAGNGDMNQYSNHRVRHIIAATDSPPPETVAPAPEFACAGVIENDS
jgi:hypothetical protein